ncbi:DNA-directed RNA polymerase 1 and 3 polypeptide [Niveomyces insectorum RCEF 264]|uniref:DNA-directed RNA polymerase 1 and 3 polypeptide n=1 Tax=Niveomyces insectorum RCEF 264 TaxID=1081102 RepID=A0A167PHB0_9HYPO|nr:DNA-directed RNA polymerase 1 and 3 polypeptide [Niveomyces insectorum RCEF 264]
MSARSRRKQPAAQEPTEDAEMADAPATTAAEDPEETTNAAAGGDDEIDEAAEGAVTVEVAEAPGGDVNEGDEEEEEEEETQRVRLLPGSTPTAASFEFLEEGHTLGNALRFIIMKNPDVEFCAYAIPHPSEAKMNIRIQTYEGTAIQALETGLRDLQDLCDVVGDKYWEARNQYVNEMKA